MSGAPASGAPSSRADVLAARRVVVKVGSSSLTSAAGGLDSDRVDALVDVIARARSAGTEVVLVSSGAIAAGLAPLGLGERPRDLARQQAAACVGQGLLVARYTASFARHGLRVGQILLTADDIGRHTQYRNAYRALAQVLAMGAVPVVNENDTVATAEIRFGDNDRLAALVAHLVRAELLVLLSDVDGLYDGAPGTPGSRRIPEVRGRGDLAGVEIGSTGTSGVGTGGMVTKVEAARIATDAGIPVVITAARHAADALGGRETGTLFHRTGERAADHLLWLEHASSPRGTLRLTPHAALTLARREGPLLATGVTRVDGDFVSGDPVELRDATGRVVARGLAGLGARELLRLQGRSAREVVHQDDLVPLAHPAPPDAPGPSATARVRIRIRTAEEYARAGAGGDRPGR
ncbi:glutamate 5-kinase [Streptomyces sp. NPDC021080]|uniref:glutamate 5-kinase n=1 Tax=Streptomyces sp. NPDC021080 TaxID=3365110 RepID=UPI0037B9094F